MTEEPTANIPQQALIAGIQQRLRLERQLKAGANWFYWIAGLSLVNSLIFLFKGGITFVIGLGLTQVVDGIAGVVARELGRQGGSIIRAAGLAVNLVIAGIFVAFGYLGRKGQRWAFITGMILYGLDIFILLWARDMFGILFHIIALAGLYRGLRAIGEIERWGTKAQVG